MFQLFGQQVTVFEIVGFVAGIAGVWLTIKESIWNFPIGLINVTASLLLFYRSQLYSDTFQQAVYIVLLSYGWYHWSRGTKKKNDLSVSTSSVKLLMILLALAVTGSVAGGFLLGRYTNASYSYWDATGTSLSLIAQWMIARKKIENWILWMVVNMLYIGIYYFKHLNLYMVLYAIFLLMAVRGYYSWKKHLVKT
ncbi:MAG: nicotinamide riboside transporter PnuC [Bacteroidetes bacterium]|nr:nicotinamide riboside transporter PnuC [Bacteroidota bacterium]